MHSVSYHDVTENV